MWEHRTHLRDRRPARVLDVTRSDEDVVERRTFCRLCAASCGMVARVDGDRVVSVRGDRSHPASRGYSCVKGRALGEVLHSARRLDAPTMAGRRVTWATLLDDLGGRFATLRAQHGPNAVGYYSATGAFPDKAGLFAERRLFRALGTTQAYTAASVDVFPAFKAAELVTGFATELQPVWEPERSPSLTLIIGQNPVVSHGYLMFLTDPVRRIRAYRRDGGALWVLDPRRTETAQLADVHLAPRPGTDGLVLAWLVRELLRDGADRAELEHHTDPVELRRLQDAVEPFTVDVVAARTEIVAGSLLALLAAIRAAGQIACLVGTGLTFGPHAVVADWLVWALLIVTGSLDRPGGMRFSQGAVARLDERTAWDAAPVGGSNGAGPPSRPDLPSFLGEYPVAALADEIEAGHLRALVVAGGNPLTSTPDPDRTERALRRLDALVVLDIVGSELTDLATHVVPVAHQLERADITLRDRVSHTPAVVPLGADRRPMWWFHAQIARRLGLDILDGLDPDEANDDDVLRLMLAAAPNAGNTMQVGDVARPTGADGLYDRIVHAGTAGITVEPRTGWVHERALPDGRWRIAPTELVARLPRLLDPPSATPFQLVSRRQSHRVNSAHYATADDPGERATLLLHPTDAAALGADDGARVRVASSAGALDGTATITEQVRPGTVSFTHGLVAGNVNDLVGSFDVDPLTGQPVMTAIDVRVELVAGPRSPRDTPIL